MSNRTLQRCLTPVSISCVPVSISCVSGMSLVFLSVWIAQVTCNILSPSQHFVMGWTCVRSIPGFYIFIYPHPVIILKYDFSIESIILVNLPVGQDLWNYSSIDKGPWHKTGNDFDRLSLSGTDYTLVQKKDRRRGKKEEKKGKRQLIKGGINDFQIAASPSDLLSFSLSVHSLYLKKSTLSKSLYSFHVLRHTGGYTFLNIFSFCQSHQQPFTFFFFYFFFQSVAQVICTTTLYFHNTMTIAMV